MSDERDLIQVRRAAKGRKGLGLKPHQTSSLIRRSFAPSLVRLGFSCYEKQQLLSIPIRTNSW